MQGDRVDGLNPFFQIKNPVYVLLVNETVTRLETTVKCAETGAREFPDIILFEIPSLPLLKQQAWLPKKKFALSCQALTSGLRTF